jgi:ribosomal protein S18 acetylase RimI-like enzyme
MISELNHTDPAVAEQIRQIMFDAYSVEAAILGVENFVPLHRTVNHIARTDASFLGISMDGTLVAVAEVERGEGRQIHIGSLVVRPSHFRKGLGSALVRHILETHGDGDITVSTGAANRPAIQLYETHSFEEHRRWQTPDGIPMITLLRKRNGADHSAPFPSTTCD